MKTNFKHSTRRQPQTVRQHRAMIEALESRQMMSGVNGGPVVAQPWTFQQGIHINRSVAPYMNATAADFSVDINWGDGTSSVTTNVLPEAGEGSAPVDYFATATHTYKYAGPADGPNQIFIFYRGQPLATAEMQVTVQDVPVIPHPTTIDVAPGGEYSGPVAMFAYNNPYASAANFVPDVELNDPVTHQQIMGTVSGGGGSYVVSVTDAHLDIGTPYSLNVAVEHILNNPFTGQSTIGSGTNIYSPVIVSSGDVFAGNSTLVAQAKQLSPTLSNAGAWVSTGAVNAIEQFGGGVGDWANGVAKLLGQLPGITPQKVATTLTKFGAAAVTTAQNPQTIAPTITAAVNNAFNALTGNSAKYLGQTLPSAAAGAAAGAAGKSVLGAVEQFAAAAAASTEIDAVAAAVGQFQQVAKTIVAGTKAGSSPWPALNKQAVQMTAQLPGTQAAKTALYKALTDEITAQSDNSWSAMAATGTDGSSVFLGGKGYAVVISPSGQVYNAALEGTPAASTLGVSLTTKDLQTFTVNYDAAKLVQ